jgi:hypothetical protein
MLNPMQELYGYVKSRMRQERIKADKLMWPAIKEWNTWSTFQEIEEWLIKNCEIQLEGDAEDEL